MRVPVEFDAIRPFEPEELPEVYERLLASPGFRAVLAAIMPDTPIETIREEMFKCASGTEFQRRMCYGFLQGLIDKQANGCDMDASAVDKSGRYTFVSNHRDIIIDPSFLGKLLVDCGFESMSQVAIGDNLLSLSWVKDLVRVNKSFIVRRGLSPRETLMASKLMSDYMHYVMDRREDHIWIAQREGRAKDSDDRTQPAILKMMAMGGGPGDVVSKLKRLRLVPLAISYEFDPCDYLKAREFQLKRDVKGWKKSAEDDIVSMKTGVMGYKGRIHYHMAPCLDDWLDTIDGETPKTELFDMIARRIDHEIHRNYRLYPCNYVALDMLAGKDDYSDKYTAEDWAMFEKYLAGRLEMIDLPEKDEPFLRERLLTMYANPAANFIAATSAND